MGINSDIRDQAYQFFIEEVGELLQLLESNLLTLKEERSTAKVHNLMRAAHSIKGGAASVGLDSITTLSHRLEDIFKSFYNEEVEIDTELETLLLQAYDCLKEPLMGLLEAGEFDGEQALSNAKPIFSKIEDRLGDVLARADDYIPTSKDLGVDIVASIFEVDVAEGLERLVNVIANPREYEIAGELRAQAEVFAGFAELLNLPGFGEIAQTAIAALEIHPHRALELTELTLANFKQAREEVLSGDRARGGNPSAELVAFLDSNLINGQTETLQQQNQQETIDAPSLDEVFGAAFEEAELELGQNTLAWGSEEMEIEVPSLDEVFGSAFEDEELEIAEETLAPSTHSEIETEIATVENVVEEIAQAKPATQSEPEIANNIPIFEANKAPETIEETVQSIEQIFAQLPSIEENSAPTELKTPPKSDIILPPVSTPIAPNPSETVSLSPKSPNTPEEIAKLQETIERLSSPNDKLSIPAPFSETQQESDPNKTKEQLPQKPTLKKKKIQAPASSSIRVDLNRLERMNNLVGELAINRNSLSLQNEQIQKGVRELLKRFSEFKNKTGKLQELSDKMLVDPEGLGKEVLLRKHDRHSSNELDRPTNTQDPQTDFDSLEMDNYGVINSVLQGLIEEVVQLEEAVDDVVLFARQSNQTIDKQRQMLTYLRDELMWARMLPLGEILSRFPRILRDLSATYSKQVRLKIRGSGVLVDKAVLEKLYDPFLHLLRNAFDHGIEYPQERRQQGKPEQGKIEITAYHLGNETFIEIKDDGKGLDLEKISRRAVERGWLSEEQLAKTDKASLLEFIFQPGFSTANEVSELSGRGIGLDVVRSQIQFLKGNISVTSVAGVGTTFTLRLPLTLTISKLLICLVGSTSIALPSDSIEEILIPKADQIKKSGAGKFLHWHNEIIPTYRIKELLEYRTPISESLPSEYISTMPVPEDWAAPLLLLRQGQEIFALEVDRIITEQELVIKPFGKTLAPPSYVYGCTILGDGSLVAAINGASLISYIFGNATKDGLDISESQIANNLESENLSGNNAPEIVNKPKINTVLVVDDSSALRRTLALTLQKAGYRVLQAQDGKEALEKLQQSSNVELVICDIEMPNMNGFQFLSERRKKSEILQIPVAMLTSRSSDKHRRLAMQLGANAYFSKPFVEQQFLVAIKDIISHNEPKTISASR
ncbi:MAG: hybrid sensor histidine kinase/response regulator [Prochloraceae cyanobacterium]|nr:hybrid sensor histidine kinase/response regulator [Prochloraceae cyanobacterium]